ncbi:hypothetical protein FIBSPDRAFT_794606 [Athelia psychrophila]|uniref:Actin-like ATPase domain-containing protein n=1 Tax=Athelia psychrophila TaxID=1759441 RepID=A0A166F1M9_9AGAM|nr:hypothetical protein FIBSPDRAFT_794606 [Fibularhizoctonia sp. CBS 109695]
MASSEETTRRGPYKGTSRRLVVSIDVGTTFTAASFCILQPGSVPKFEEILRWPKQAVPDAKVPSVLYYDTDDKACAFGAETDDEDTIIKAEEEEWRKTEWWKLHLRPSHLPIIKDLKLPSLPANVTVDDIFADHLGYVNRQVKEYITSTYGDGANIWDTLSPTMYVILTTPNGWEGSQQNRMRQAAIKAGLVDANGGQRVKFVSEAEAAVLYAADTGSVNDWLVQDGHLIICDCGGGTIDITGYKITGTAPLRLEESSASRCYLAGAVFVTEAAKTYLKTHLKTTEWDNEDAINKAVSSFDRSAKRKFEGPDSTSWIQLDGHKTLPKLNITRGKMKISGETMASFYAESLRCIKEGLDIAFENGQKMADKIILVGGLASSPYVYAELVKWGKDSGISVSRPDGPTTKAVANGALAWHIDNAVTSRFARYHYGVEIRATHDPANKEHEGRETYPDPHDGTARILNVWSGIVKKNVKVEGGQEFISSYRFISDSDVETFERAVKVFVYRRAVPPLFTTFPGKARYQPGFEVICTVQADLKQCLNESPISVYPNGDGYRTINFEMCLSLGETEIAARMRWKEDGEYKYSPASIAYE